MLEDEQFFNSAKEREAYCAKAPDPKKSDTGETLDPHWKNDYSKLRKKYFVPVRRADKNKFVTKKFTR